ncbi:hypothetical protein V6N13_109638 [Hibiscus sabdariffa]|uniref:Uncharacterized protein n=1 Tax=Hibiscus sabdariffa TaxID=183260 RepID=A0ABR2FQ81_9ROSI
MHWKTLVLPPTTPPRLHWPISLISRGSCSDFAVKIDRVNYVEVEAINSWRQKIQEHRGIREVSRLLISAVKDSSVVFSG